MGEGKSDGSIRYNRWERERVMEVFVLKDGRGGKLRWKVVKLELKKKV